MERESKRDYEKIGSLTMQEYFSSIGRERNPWISAGFSFGGSNGLEILRGERNNQDCGADNLQCMEPHPITITEKMGPMRNISFHNTKEQFVISHNDWWIPEVAWVAGLLLVIIGGGAIWVEA